MPGKRTRESQQTNKENPTRPRDARPTIGLLGVFPDYAAPVTQKWDANQIRFSCGDLRSTIGFEAQANVLTELAGAENVDGLVIWSDYIGHYIGADEMRAFCEQYHPLPVVSIGLVEGIPSVLVDNYQGVYQEVIHLIEAHGCRRIACIRGPKGNVEADERYRAYVDALAAHNIPLNDKLVVTGGFKGATGQAAMKALFGRRKKPHFDALVTVTDEVAIVAIEFLQARGVRVPDDIAVVGFDDEGAGHTPPITSVRAAWREATMRSVEMVLALLEGKKVPERLVLPSELIVRQSCGCPSITMVEAAAEPEAKAGETFKAALSTQREAILTALMQAVKDPITRLDPVWEVKPLDTLTTDLKAWVEQLLDAFAAESKRKAQGTFLSTLDEVLAQATATGSSANAWQGAISTLRRYALPYLADDQDLARVEDLWQQARVMIGEQAERARLSQAMRTRQKDAELHRVGQALITTFGLEGLLDTLAQELPRLGFPSCYLSLYRDQKTPTEWAQMVFAYNEKGRIKLEKDGTRFPSRQLTPTGLLPDRRHQFMVEPLYFRENQIGFVLLESGPSGRDIYATLQGHISSALQTALLVRQVESRSLQLQTAAEVSRTASSILDPDELIQQVVDLARERFELYYAGLFLVDETKEWAVLQAGTGKAGQKMVREGHKLQVGGDSMIGQCVATDQARIALDVGEEAVRFENPSLPQTRSELALPLISRGEAIGALTIQSSQEAAFSQEDIAVLQTMADQLANAIQNARLFEQTQTALAETKGQATRLTLLSELSGQLSRAADFDEIVKVSTAKVSQIFAADRVSVAMLSATGDSFDIFALRGAAGATPVGTRMEAEGTEMELAVRERRLVIRGNEPREHLGNIRSFMVAPLIAGGKAIGTLNVASQGSDTYTQSEGTLLLQTAALISAAIENSRLFKQTQDALEEVEATHRRYLERVWTEYLETTKVTGYETERPGTVPLGDTVWPEIQQATEQQSATVSTGDGAEGKIYSALVAPVTLRGAAIGALGIHDEDGERQWSNDEVALIQTIADRMAVAAENLRLIEETQRRAARDRLTGEVTARMRETLDMETMLKTIVQEVRQTLGVPEVVVRLGTSSPLPRTTGDGHNRDEPGRPDGKERIA